MSAPILAATMCSGIGAPELAAPHFDWVAAADIGAFPRALFRERWPGAELHGDLTKIDLGRSAYARAEVLVAGTPCQAFSFAGMRKGLGDERGQITLAFVDAIRDLTARSLRAVVWENVPGVLSAKKGEPDAFAHFLAALVGHDRPLQRAGKRWPDVGMVAGPRGRLAWRVFDAQHFGLAQRRRRLFLVFDPRGDGIDPAAVLFEPKGLRRDTEAGEEPGAGAAGGAGGGASGGEQSGGAGSRGRSQEEADGAGRPESPEIARAVPTSTQSLDASVETLIAIAPPVCGTLTARTKGGGGLGTDLEHQGGLVPMGPPGVVAFSAKDHGADANTKISPTLRAGNFDKSHANGGVMPAIAFNLRGREGGAMPEAADKASLRAASGGSSRSYVAAFDLSQVLRNRALVEDGRPSPTLASTGKPFVAVGASQEVADGGTVGVQAGWAVRRLTPTECERLQGMPDGHTLIPYRRAEASDTPRYHAIGNSMAVPVLSWILERLERELRGEDW